MKLSLQHTSISCFGSNIARSKRPRIWIVRLAWQLIRPGNTLVVVMISGGWPQFWKTFSSTSFHHQTMLASYVATCTWGNTDSSWSITRNENAPTYYIPDVLIARARGIVIVSLQVLRRWTSLACDGGGATLLHVDQQPHGDGDTKRTAAETRSRWGLLF